MDSIYAAAAIAGAILGVAAHVRCDALSERVRKIERQLRTEEGDEKP